MNLARTRGVWLALAALGLSLAWAGCGAEEAPPTATPTQAAPVAAATATPTPLQTTPAATPPPTQAAPTATPPPAPVQRAVGEVDGVAFVVGEGSEATFTVTEQLANLPLPIDAVMRTTGLSGEVRLDGGVSEVAVDLHSMTSDSSQRDNYVRFRMFPGQPSATVAFGDLRPLPDGFTDGEEVSTSTIGELSINDVTHPLEFEIEAETQALCRTIPLDDLPAERIWGEVEKLLLEAARPSVGLRVARELGVVDRLFPELAALVDCPQEPEWHPEGDVWIHTLLVVDEARGRIDDLPYPQRVAVMLGAVCHDLGKPATTAHIDGRIRSLNHEAMGVEPAAAFLDRLNVRTLDGYDVRGQVLGLVGHHLKPGMWRAARDGVGDGAFRRLARKVDLELLARVAAADCRGRTGRFDCSAMDWFLERARSLGVEHAPPAPLLLGRHVLALGVRPGPRVGAVLRQVYERQLDGEVTTLEEATAAARALLAEDP